MFVLFQCDAACLMGCRVLECLSPFGVRPTGNSSRTVCAVRYDCQRVAPYWLHVITSGEYFFGRIDLLPKRLLKHNYEKDVFYEGAHKKGHNIHISLLLALD